MPDGLVLFRAVSGEITWMDINTQDGGEVISTDGANTPALAIGPEGFLCFGVAESGGRKPAQVVRISDHLDRDVIVDGLTGIIVDIAFDTDGALYILSHKKDAFSLHHYTHANKLSEIPLVDPFTAYSSLAIHPGSNHVLVASVDALLEYKPSGYVARHALEFPEVVFGTKIAGNLDNAIYISAEGKDNFFTGPSVKRWLYQLDPNDYSLRQLARIDLSGCGPMSNLAVDPDGNAWWLLNPDFCLYRVTPGGEVTLFAKNLFVDPAGVAVDSEGDIYFSSPEGIHRIYRK